MTKTFQIWWWRQFFLFVGTLIHLPLRSQFIMKIEIHYEIILFSVDINLIRVLQMSTNAQTTPAKMELLVSIFQEVIAVTAQKVIQGVLAKQVNITHGQIENDIWKIHWTSNWGSIQITWACFLSYMWSHTLYDFDFAYTALCTQLIG